MSSERFESIVERAARPQSLAQPRVIVGLVLILAGVVWAIARGLHFYGLAPVDLYYDLDQPPVLVVFVAAWLLGWRRGA